MEAYGHNKATINQVAHLAGVSVTTVSVYLRGLNRVCSHATALRIDAAVAELNYQPNPLAGTAYNKERRTIGLLAGNDLERGNKAWMVYNMRLVNGIFEVANQYDYSILTYPYRVFLERQHRAVLDGRVDAILFYGNTGHDLVRELVDAGMPVVCFGSPECDDRVAGWAHLNENTVSNLALNHLWSLGHRRIGHIAGPFEDCYRNNFSTPNGQTRLLEPAEPVSRARMNAAIQFLKERQAFDSDLISGPHAWKNSEITPTLERWRKLASPPTAIYAANDYLAWEAIRWARLQRIRIPEDLAIVGVDNVEGPDRELFLSSVDIEVEEIGRQAMRAILDVLGGAEHPTTQRTIEPSGLIERGSTVTTPSPESQERGRFAHQRLD